VVNSILTQYSDIFQEVKEIPFSEVFRKFSRSEMRRQGRFFVALCPFHKEKTPSFTVYDNGFKCWGCGEAGDHVAFVAKLYSLRPLDAARLICENFGLPVNDGPLSREDRLRITQAKAIREREKQIQEGFKKWEWETTQKVRPYVDASRTIFEEKGIDIDPELLPLIHQLPLLEYWADILNGGTDEEKLDLYRNADFRRWFS